MDYKDLIKSKFKKKEVFRLIRQEKYEDSRGKYYVMIIRDCIDKESELGKKGMAHIATVARKVEDIGKMRNRCYEAFLFDYARGMIKKDLI